MIHPKIKNAVFHLRDKNLDSALNALDVAMGEGSHEAARLLAFLLDRYSETTEYQMERWVEQSFERLGSGDGFAAYSLGCIAQQQFQPLDVVLDFYSKGLELGDSRCGVNVAISFMGAGDLDSASGCVAKLRKLDDFYGIWLQTALDSMKSGSEEPDKHAIQKILALAEPDEFAFVIQSFGAFEMVSNENVHRTLQLASTEGCHRSTSLLAMHHIQSLSDSGNADRFTEVEDLLVLGTLQGNPVCAAELARLAMLNFESDQNDDNYESLIVAALDAAYLGVPGWMHFVQAQAVRLGQFDFAKFWFDRILNCHEEEIIAEARSIMEQPEADASESDNTPEYFHTLQSNFTTGLAEYDISRTLLTDDSPGSFPMLPILEMDGFLDSVIRRDEKAFETVQMWQREGRSNYLSALGFLLRIQGDHSLGIEILEASGEMGNVHAWFNLGCEPEGLTPVQRESYLRKAVEMKHAGAAYLLALMALEENDFGTANEWLIRAAKLGDATATRALSQMVTSEDERSMLAKVADEQAQATDSTRDLPEGLAEPALLDPLPPSCTWENLVALRSANVGLRWWSSYGPQTSVDLEGVNWQVSPVFRNPESNVESHAEPIREGFRQIDTEFEDSLFLERVSRAGSRLGLKLHSMLTPVNVDGLLGTWVTPDGLNCIQFATAFQNTRDPSTEAVLWQVQLLAYPESPDISTSLNSQSYVGALLETAFYMAEMQRPTLNDLLDEPTRDLKFGNLSNDLTPCPYLRISQAETVGTFQNGNWSGCHAGMVFSGGYFISSKLTDEQLELVLPAIADALILVVDCLSGAINPPVGVPSIHEFAQVRSLRDLLYLSGNLTDDIYHSTSNPQLRLASGLGPDDQVWPESAMGNQYSLVPEFRDALYAALVHETDTNPDWTNSLAFKDALDAGLLEALDLAAIEAEGRGDLESAGKFYLEGARRGYPQALNNLAGITPQLFEDEDGYLIPGLYLSAGLCGDAPARRNLRKILDDFMLAHSESDFLLDADLLNNLGWSVYQNVSMSAALPVFEAACRVGSSNALATYTWWTLSSGETAQGIDMFENCIASVRERSVTEFARNQVTNAFCNYALLLFAVGRDVEALEIVRGYEQLNNPEAIGLSAVISRKHGDHEQSNEIARSMSHEAKIKLKEIAKEVLNEQQNSWFAQYARTLLEVISDSEQATESNS